MKTRRGKGPIFKLVSSTAFVCILASQVGCDLQSVTGGSPAANELAKVFRPITGYANFSMDVARDDGEVIVIATPAE